MLRVFWRRGELSRNHYYEDLVSRILREELVLVNKHIPYKRYTLCELLSMDTPHYVSRDGNVYLIDPRELKLLGEYAGEESCNLYIPIIIEYKPSMGEATYVIREPVASKVISKFLSIEYISGELVIYRSQLSVIRNKFRTTTTIVFTPS